MTDFGIICACAVRYALGRRTYVTSVVPSFISSNRQYLSIKELQIIKRDIVEAIEKGEAGDPNIDLPNWQQLVSWIDSQVENEEC